MFSGLMGSVVTGMAMGTGSAVAHRAVDSMMGPREMTIKHENEPAAAAPQPVAVSVAPSPECVVIAWCMRALNARC
jgi:hypothetical protein